jgi:uncharacterized delta-60 repeat protein
MREHLTLLTFTVIAQNAVIAQAGSLDPTFSGDGKFVHAASTDLDEIFAMAIQPDGKIVGAGYRNDGSPDDFLVVRLLPDGSFDPSFSTDGVVVTPVSSGQTELTLF